MAFLLRRAKRQFSATLIFSIISAFLFPTSIFANTKIMPAKDVRIGMKGFGKTVIEGRKIETFEVEVLGILANNKVNESPSPTGQSFMVRVSGDVIRRAGGIAAGMSGSPVYINNMLIGGISSGWLMTDHTVGLVTPIEEMIAIWQYPNLSAALPSGKKSADSSIWTLSEPVKLAGKEYNKIREVPFTKAEEICLEEDEAAFVYAASDILIEGLSGKAAANVKNRFKDRNIRIMESKFKTSYSEPARNPDLFAEISPSAYEPGSSIGIQLARGDINMVSLGTLTHREGELILGLSHSFLGTGAVSYLMTAAYIHHSFSSVQMPFKIGSPVEMIGIITQDREKGVAGEIGRLPLMIPISIDVSDRDINISKTINFQIVRDPSVFLTILESSILQAINSSMDRTGGGTAKIGISFECANRENKYYFFRRDNIFYSKNDIAQTIASDLISIMENVTENEDEEVMPTRILIKLEIQKERKTLAIEKVEIKNSSITSGGVLNVEVTLKPYRKPSFIRKVDLTIPDDIGKETLVLSVQGLNLKPSEHQNLITDEHKPPSESGGSSFEDKMKYWVSSPKNSDLIFTLYPEGNESNKLNLNGKSSEIQPTNFVVIGKIENTITLSEE